MESGSSIWILNKDKANSLEEAMLIQILVDEMKYGNYHFTEKDENKVLNLNLNLLKHKYNCEIQINKDKDLKMLFADYCKEPDVVTMNYDWPNQISIDRIKNEPCFNENIIKSYVLLNEWNDVDYIFETDNYYIRFNWGTAA